MYALEPDPGNNRFGFLFLTCKTVEKLICCFSINFDRIVRLFIFITPSSIFMSKLPVLEYVKMLYPSISLDGVLIIGCQHILETTHVMFRFLYERGLKPANIFLLGKCYSSNPAVLEEMREDGISVSLDSLFFEESESFDEQFYCITRQFLEHTISKVDLSKFNKIIIMDDGGQLLTLAMEYLKCNKSIVGIEQTSSGYEKIKCKSLPFSVINVARSQAKLQYESPVIAEVVIQKGFKRIENLRLIPRSILIIGNGAIGSAIYQLLKDFYEVVIYDQQEEENDKERGKIDAYLPEAELIIGCTGNTSIPVAKHPLVKRGCVLCSASSSDREFDAVYIRRQATKIRNCHDDIALKDLVLLNCGFPVNFDGGRNSVIPSKIQLTRALLAAAILEASQISGRSSEVIAVNSKVQEAIINRYFQMNSTCDKRIDLVIG